MHNYKLPSFKYTHNIGLISVYTDENNETYYKQSDSIIYFKHNPTYFHRIHGPAIIHPLNLFWYRNNHLHRLDGPAVEHSNGDKEYFINNIRYGHEETKEYLHMVKLIGFL